MTIQFCPKCKSIVIPRVVKGESLLLCNECGWYKIIKKEIHLKTEDKPVRSKERAEGVVAGENELADYHHKCTKCGYDKAEIMDAGVQISDEDELIMLKCGKCGFVERLGTKCA